MPFDFQAYDQKCAALTAEELQREWQHYTRLITGAATSTTVSGLALPLTLGVSSVGIAMAAPAIHNARKKREIIERHLQRHDARHVTRKRDVLGGAAVSGTIGVVTLGVGTMGADAVAQQGAEHGINAIVANETAIKVVTHAALDGVGMGVEHMHTDRVKKREARKAFEKAGVFQAVDDAKAKEAGYAYTPSGQQQYPYGLQAQMSGASSSRLSVVSAPPPYSPGQEHLIPGQQSTQYQPTAMNVPAYYNEQYPQYATLDTKVDPYTSHQQQPPVEWAGHQTVSAANASQANTFSSTTVSESISRKPVAGNDLPPPIPAKEAAEPPLVVMAGTANVRPGEPQATDMDDLIANIDQQLKFTEAIATHYELEGSQEMTQPPIFQQPSQDTTSPQTTTVQNSGSEQMHQVSSSATVPPVQHMGFSQPNSPPCPRPTEQIQAPSSAQSVDHGHVHSYGQQVSASMGQPAMTPQSTGSSYPYQDSHPSTSIAQPIPTHPTAPPSERYVPTPMTPPSQNPSPAAHHQQPSQPHVPHVPTPMTPPFYQQEQQPSQTQTYFPPPPLSAVTPQRQPQPPQPVVSKRRSIMAAVALKATQTLAQHRTPSAAAYKQPQYSASSPQPQNQPQMYQSVPQQPGFSPQPQHQAYQQYHPQPQQGQLQPQAQQVHTQQRWSQPQQQTYQNPYHSQPGHSVEEPVYAPVPVPQAYSTRPQSQIFPPTPISPPNIPTVQQPQQQQPGYFPPPTEYKPGQFGLPANLSFPPTGQGQGYYPQQ